MKKYAKSNELLVRARNATPVGAQTYSKSVRYFCEGESPAFLERGKGSRVWDVDGNEYIDFICGLGAVTVGYADERINEAILKQMERGISFPQATEIEVELCERLIQIIPCAEMVRLVKNGSDATFAAVKLARAYTGREMVAVCGYHGMHDWYIGSTVNNAGVPQKVRELTKTFVYNDIESLERIFNENESKIAAVILEPIQADGPKEGFLEEIRQLTERNGAVLIFDEVVSGFRYALGGASEMYNVKPDMAAVGKGMSNGMPISAVAGRKEIMKLIEAKGVFVSTTFGGETLSIAAALKTLDILSQKDTYKAIWEKGTELLNGLRKIINDNNLSKVLRVSGLAPHGGLEFHDAGELDYLDINSVYQQAMVDQGILSIGINNISLSHTREDIARHLEAAEIASRNVTRAIENKSTEGLLRGMKVNPIFKRNI